MSKFKTKPQSACKKWKSKKLGKNEYWSPALLGDKKIETIDMETGFIEEEFQDDEEGDLSMEYDNEQIREGVRDKRNCNLVSLEELTPFH